MEQANRSILVSRPQSKVNVNKREFLLTLKAGLDKNLDNPNLSEEIMAQEMKMSASTLNDAIKSILNQSITDFIKQYRLQRAAEFLSVGYKVSEVSQRVGFKTRSNFIQNFKEYYQKTPAAFLKEFADA